MPYTLSLTAVLQAFLDDGRWSEIDDDVRAAILEAWDQLKVEWDKLHGKFNSISSDMKE